MGRFNHQFGEKKKEGGGARIGNKNQNRLEKKISPEVLKA